MENLERDIQEIKVRNKRVELDKAWETSPTRKLSIAILTYFVITLFFLVAGFSKPLLNSLVPTAGYILSTLSLPIIKKWWTEGKDKNVINESKKIIATRALLDSQGDSDEQIEATIALMSVHDQEKLWESLRSWLGVITGVCALIVSVIVAIAK